MQSFINVNSMMQLFPFLLDGKHGSLKKTSSYDRTEQQNCKHLKKHLQKLAKNWQFVHLKKISFCPLQRKKKSPLCKTRNIHLVFLESNYYWLFHKMCNSSFLAKLGTCFDSQQNSKIRFGFLQSKKAFESLQSRKHTLALYKAGNTL